MDVIRYKRLNLTILTRIDTPLGGYEDHIFCDLKYFLASVLLPIDIAINAWETADYLLRLLAAVTVSSATSNNQVIITYDSSIKSPYPLMFRCA